MTMLTNTTVQFTHCIVHLKSSSCEASAAVEKAPLPEWVETPTLAHSRRQIIRGIVRSCSCLLTIEVTHRAFSRWWPFTMDSPGLHFRLNSGQLSTSSAPPPIGLTMTDPLILNQWYQLHMQRLQTVEHFNPLGLQNYLAQGKLLHSVWKSLKKSHIFRHYFSGKSAKSQFL